MALVSKILNAATTDATSEWLPLNASPFTVCASIVGTGAVSVTVTVQTSHDASVAYAHTTTISLSGTNSDVDMLAVSSQWKYARVVLSSITGTGAAVTVTVCQSRDVF